MTEAIKDFQQMGIDFQLNLKEYIQKTDALSKKSLIRIQKALAAYPLEEGIVELVHDDEKDVYKLGVEIQSIKLNMMVESLRQDAEEARINAIREQRKSKNPVPENIDKPDYAE